jgi:hypothetical protein
VERESHAELAEDDEREGEGEGEGEEAPGQHRMSE